MEHRSLAVAKGQNLATRERKQRLPTVHTWRRDVPHISGGKECVCVCYDTRRMRQCGEAQYRAVLRANESASLPM